MDLVPHKPGVCVDFFNKKRICCIVSPVMTAVQMADAVIRKPGEARKGQSGALPVTVSAGVCFSRRESATGNTGKVGK